ncbi:MAG: SufS family cysteine desulfurase [Erysipelotrichales bacterium]|nr:SufS family cysteine desulfurase [Erysipelotrichales bacterium]
MKVNEYKALFPVLKENPKLSYLDSAASSLKPFKVIEAIDSYYRYSGVNVHRGVYRLSYQATKLFEEARQKVAEFINCSESEVIFTRGASAALNLACTSYQDFLNEGDEIITSELEHHSSLLPWMEAAKRKKCKLRYIPLDKEGRITLANFKKVLTAKTKVVALIHVSNVMGYITPLEEIIEAAHQKNAVVIVDACQSAPHIQIDVKKLNCDFLAFSAHKMCGPTGVGVLYGKKALLKKMRPIEFGGDMVETVNHDDFITRELPFKFETGTPMIAEVIGFSATLDFLLEIGYDKIRKIEEKLTSYTMEKIKKIEGITVYNPTTEGNIILFNIDGVHPHDAATIFDKNDVCLRAGHHCCQLMSKWLKSGSTLRASFYLYNDLTDCDRFIESVKEAVEFFKQF